MTLIGNCTIFSGDGEAWSGMRLQGPRIVELLEQSPTCPDVDLDGAVVLPPLVDTHLHLVAIGQARTMVDASRVKDLDQLAGELRALAPDSTGTRFARQFSERLGTPTRAWFERIGGRVALLSPDLHAAWVSPRVLQDAGVDAQTPDPRGGRYRRGADGEPDGYVLDAALDLVRVRFAVDDPSRVEALLLEGMRACAEVGLHEVHEIATTPAMWRGLCALAQRGELPVRVCAYGYGPVEAWTDVRSPSGSLRFCGYKVFLDGAMGSRGAWLSEPYSDLDANAPDPSGLCLCPPDELAEWSRLARERDLQLAVHAIGDAAVAAVLDLPRGAPHALRIEHAQIVAPKDLPRARGVVAAMQPHHRRDDASILRARLGERAAWAFPMQALADAGALVCFGSDAPVSELSPLEGMAAAGEAGVRDPLRGYCIDAMRASRSERKGSLHAGGPADFTVVDRPPGLAGGRVLARWRSGAP